MSKKIDKALVIRTCNADMTAHGGFVWPKEGKIAAPDWSPDPVCGKDLHGLIDGVGDYGLLSRDANAVWQIAEVDRSACVHLDGKVKFQECNVIYSGAMPGALSMISNEWIKIAIAAGKEGATTGESAHAATTGEKSIACCLGLNSKAAAGKDGALILSYWDEKKDRPRVVVGYVGEEGIKAGVKYRLNDQHKFEEVADE